jgi:hypothetical protein
VSGAGASALIAPSSVTERRYGAAARRTAR